MDRRTVIFCHSRRVTSNKAASPLLARRLAIAVALCLGGGGALIARSCRNLAAGVVAFAIGRRHARVTLAWNAADHALMPAASQKGMHQQRYRCQNVDAITEHGKKPAFKEPWAQKRGGILAKLSASVNTGFARCKVARTSHREVLSRCLAEQRLHCTADNLHGFGKTGIAHAAALVRWTEPTPHLELSVSFWVKLHCVPENLRGFRVPVRGTSLKHRLTLDLRATLRGSPERLPVRVSSA